jgi:ABC-type dipeptide/oligopeptide/nickel transport system permease component
MRAVLLFVGRRLAASAVAVLILALVVFLLIKAIPGDEARVAAGAAATPQQVAAVRHSLGLDRPLLGQLVSYFGRLVHGNLGTSISSDSPVTSGIETAMPVTLELVVLATLLMIVFAVPAAILTALQRDDSADTAVRVSVLTLAAIPTFWLALELQQLVSVKLGIFPISGSISSNFNIPHRTGSTILDALLAGNLPAWWNALEHYLLPAFILMIPFATTLFRTLRTELITVLSREHIVVARANGLGTRRLVLRHALPNAFGPALTVIGVEFGTMLGAAVLVEGVFGLSGMGAYLTTAVANKDTFAVLGGVLVIGVLVVAANFVVDMLQLVRDPRLRTAQIGMAG